MSPKVVESLINATRKRKPHDLIVLTEKRCGTIVKVARFSGGKQKVFYDAE